jgi:quercetin dioxygenase-like cupin family protein
MADSKETKTEGALKAGDGNNVFQLKEMAGISAGGAYSTARGGVVEGEKTMVGLMCKPRGTGARPHSHPNEQWNYVVQGKLDVNIDGKECVAGPGTLLYFPANIVHSTVAQEEEDVFFFVVKDTSHSIHGIPADGKNSGPAYRPGFEPDA